jgi:hypothetical protein
MEGGTWAHLRRWALDRNVQVLDSYLFIALSYHPFRKLPSLLVLSVQSTCFSKLQVQGPSSLHL